MAWICKACGKINETGVKNCKFCGAPSSLQIKPGWREKYPIKEAKPEEGGVYVGKGILGNVWTRFFIFLIIIVLVLLSIFRSFISLIDRVATIIITYLAPGFMGAYQLFKWLIIFLIAGTFAYFCASMHPIPGIITCVVIILILGFVPGIIAAGIVSPGGKLGQYFNCLFRMDFTECLKEEKEEKIEIPPYSKEKNIYRLVEVTLGAEVTGYKLPPVISNQKYSFPLVIKNLVPEEKINITIEGKLTNTTNFTILTSPCKTRPCELEKLLEIWMESEEPVNLTGELKVVVTVSYSWPGWGRNYFVLAGTDKDLIGTEFPRPYTSIGPVDVIVFFIPRYYVVETKLYRPNTTRMYIVLQNKEADRGDAWIKKIDIARAFELPNFRLKNCISEDAEFTQERNIAPSQPLHLQKYDIWITCEYDLSKIRGIEGKDFLPFIVHVDYNFVETISKKVEVKKPE